MCRAFDPEQFLRLLGAASAVSVIHFVSASVPTTIKSGRGVIRPMKRKGSKAAKRSTLFQVKVLAERG